MFERVFQTFLVTCFVTTVISVTQTPIGDVDLVKSVPKGSISEVKGDDPYLYNCTSNSQCTNALQQCYPGGSGSDYNFCNCICGGSSCTQNKDCCTNICNNGICATTGGTQGCVCMSRNPSCPNSTILCGHGYSCRPWGDYGYCNDLPITTTQSVKTAPETTRSEITQTSSRHPPKTTTLDIKTKATTFPPADVCSNHGNYTCNCFYGYTGQHCENEINFCDQLITDYRGAPVKSGDLCVHGICVSSSAGASCNCNQGFTGQFCQDEVMNETVIATRCALYPTSAIQQWDVPIGCPSKEICVPDDLNCAVYQACQKPLGWCIPSNGDSNFLEKFAEFMQKHEILPHVN